MKKLLIFLVIMFTSGVIIIEIRKMALFCVF